MLGVSIFTKGIKVPHLDNRYGSTLYGEVGTPVTKLTEDDYKRLVNCLKKTWTPPYEPLSHPEIVPGLFFTYEDRVHLILRRHGMNLECLTTSGKVKVPISKMELNDVNLKDVELLIELGNLWT